MTDNYSFDQHEVAKICLKSYKYNNTNVQDVVNEIQARFNSVGIRSSDAQVAISLEATKVARAEFDRFISDVVFCLIFKDKQNQIQQVNNT